LSDLPPNVRFDDVWFNAWPQIRKANSSQLGPVDGEILSEALKRLNWRSNHAFGGAAVVVPRTGAVPEKTLAGGMKLTVLSPGMKQLATLRAEWKKVVEDNGLDPGKPDRWKKLLALAASKGVKSSLLGEPDVKRLAASKFSSDTAAANGSTIGLLAEYDGKSALLSGDAHAPVLLDSLKRLRQARGANSLRVDAFKLPHHGSRANVNNDLVAILPAAHYLFSTSGAIFGHPDDEAVARVIAPATPLTRTLHFNYTAATIAKNYKKKKKKTQPDWRKPSLKHEHHYEARFPQSDDVGIVLDL
jgi:hypothetical protein